MFFNLNGWSWLNAMLFLLSANSFNSNILYPIYCLRLCLLTLWLPVSETTFLSIASYGFCKISRSFINLFINIHEWPMFIFNGELRSMDSVQCVKMLSLEIGGCPLHTGKEQMRQGKVKSNTLIIIDGDSLWCLHTLAPCSSSITQMIAHARKALLCLQVRMLWEVCTPVVSLTALATPTTRSKEETRADLRRCFRTHSAHVGGEVPPAGRIIQMM